MKKYIIIISIFLILCIAGGILFYYFYQTNPSVILKKSLKSEISKIRTEIANIDSATYNSLYSSKLLSKKNDATIKLKPLNTKIDISSTVSFDNDLKKESKFPFSLLEHILSEYSATLTISSDKDQKYVDGKIDFTYNKEKTSANVYIDGNNIYFKDKDFLDKYIQLNNKYGKILNGNLELKEINTLLAILEKSIDDTKMSDKIISTEENVKIGDNTINTKKMVLDIDEELLVRIYKNYIKNVSASKSAMDTLKKIYDLSESTTIEDINKKLQGNFALLTTSNLKIATYTTGTIPKFVMQSVNFTANNEDGKIDIINSNINGYLKHLNIEYNDIKINISMNETTSEKDITADINIGNNNYRFDISGVLNPKEIDAVYSLVGNEKNIVKGDIKYSQKFESNKKDAGLNVTFDASEVKFGKGSIKIDLLTKQVSAVKKAEFNPTVNLEDITLNDTLLFKVNFTKKLPSFMKIYNSMGDKQKE